MIYHFKSLVLVRKGRAFYATLYQEVFFDKTGGGGSLKQMESYPENLLGTERTSNKKSWGKWENDDDKQINLLQ